VAVTAPGYASYPSLRDRTVFVSGGATGLGEELVRQFMHQGSKVGFADIDDDSASRLCDDVEAGCGRRPLYLPADVRDIPRFTSAIHEAGRRLGTISVLVNNAANDQRRDSDEIDLEFWNDKLAVNLSHHFFAVQAVASGMHALGGGSIINLGSVSVHIPLTSVAPYVASKAAIEGLTRTLARELGESRIRVNCVIPGWIMTARQLRDWVTPEAERLIESSQDLPDKLRPADVARLVLWLAVDDSAMCTGQNWVVDGGWI
jgi:NAD(P)-dependent dehydrogenase (short-subunit alcohol dehydrogenase family)